MKVAATGDLHFDHSSRWEECTRIHAFMAQDFRERGIDLAVVPGDWYERASRPVERLGAIETFIEPVTNFCPLLGVRGNHDQPGDLALFNKLRPKHRVYIEETVSVVQQPTAHGTAAVALVAWVRKAEVLAQLERNVGKEESESIVREEVRKLMLGLRDQLKQNDGPRILAMHTMICGATTSSGQPLTGCDLEMSLEELALTEADIIFISHVHKPQDWVYNGIPIIYCGSPYATAYGETEVKGYVVAEFADSRDKHSGKILETWYRVPTPRTPMLLLECQYMPESDEFYSLGDEEFDYSTVAGADIRFRYTVDSDYAEPARLHAEEVEKKFLADGAVAVKMEKVVNSSNRARVPEIAKMASHAEKLGVYFGIKKIEMTPERLARVLGKVQDLETEARG